MSQGHEDKLAGKVKEGAGKLTGDRDLEAEGKGQQIAGRVERAGEKLKNKAEDLGDSVNR
jgi:uncharacterized protein YjbJ (UPF0337 family)